MYEEYNTIFNSILFKDLDKNKVLDELKLIGVRVKKYHKDEIVAIEDSPCKSLAIILEGEVVLQKIYASGKIFTLRKLSKSQIFGEVVVFSDRNTYPASIVATTPSKIMFIDKEDVLKLCQIDKNFLNNFMRLMASKILTLNSKLKEMSFKNIREKLSNFIIEEYKKQNSSKIKLSQTKKEIALNLGVLRPSLSRELIKMREEGILDFYGSYIHIKDIDKLYDILN